jgi:hypothetical protein
VGLRRLPLRGADLVLMAMHSHWKHTGLSNNALLAVECDGPIPAARVREALDRLLDVCPWPSARLSRSFPLGTLHWAAGSRRSLSPAPVRQRAGCSAGDLQRELETELNSAIDPAAEPPLRMLIADCAVDPRRMHGMLVLTWFHPLMDPRGAQNLLMHLARLDRHGPGSPWGETLPPCPPDPAALPLRERGRIARKSVAYMKTLAPIPPVSLGTGLSTPGRLRFRRESFTEDASSNGAETPRDICSRLAHVGGVMAELWQRRGLPDVPFLVPIAVDLRPKGAPGPTFGNRLAFHFARFRPSDTVDVPELARSLRRQMADAVREGQIDANAVAMEFLRYRPVSMMQRAFPWVAAGETFSFNCADVTDFPALDTLFGRRVVNAYHVPAVLPRPGVGVFFNRCGDANNLVTSWVDPAVSEGEIDYIMQSVRDAMGWKHRAR